MIGSLVVILPKYALLVGVVAGSLSMDMSVKTHRADDSGESLLSVRVHVRVRGVDRTLLPGDPTVSLDARDVDMVKSTKCEALDGATVFGHIDEVSETPRVKKKGGHNAT